MMAKKQFSIVSEGSDDGGLSAFAASMFANADTQRVRQAVADGLLVQSDEGWHFGRVTIGRIGITVPDDLNEQEYGDLGAFLLDMGSRLNWLLGDWLAYGENRQWGETYQKVAEQFGYEYQTLMDYAYVCRNVNFSFRNEKLTFTHHRAVAALEPDAQQYWLNMAAENTWSITQLKQAIRAKSTMVIAPTTNPWKTQVDKLLKSTIDLDVEERRALADRLEEIIHVLRDA
ncbi:MAG: hypothetical protein ACOYL5_19535 [Phototrophicaceae bacterium]